MTTKGLRRLFGSSIGRKFFMALTGLLLICFLIGHLAGNLLIFTGREAINAYAQWLHDHPKLVWSARAGLLLLFGLHLWLGLSLQLANRAARGSVAYAHPGNVQLGVASRSMLWTGLLVLAYLIYHLLHFTLGVVQPAGYAMMDGDRRDVFAMVVTGFQHPLVAGSYVVAMLLLGLHLLHGTGSFFQTLGVNHPRYTPLIERIAKAFTVILILAYLSIPAACFFGFLTTTS